MHFKVSNTQLQNFLTKCRYQPQFQQETGQIYLLQQHSGIELASFLRILDDGKLLQVITFIPVKIRSETVNDLGRILHKINRDLDFPGFCMDESTKLVFYRIVMPCLHQQCDGDLLEAHLKAIPKICASFYPLIETIASGSKTYDELISQLASSASQDDK
jgi:hypothetical protein